MSLVETTYGTIGAAQAAFNLKEDLKAQGWSVAISSDGTTYNGSGDAISGSGSGAGGIDNADAYFLLRQSGAPDWLFERGADSQTWTISHSASAAFAGGDATNPPTAGDSFIAFDGNSLLLFPSPSLDTVTVEAEDSTPFRWAVRSTDLSFSDNYAASIGAETRPLLLYSLNYTGGFFVAPTDADAWADVVEMMSISGGAGSPPTIDNWSPAPGAVSRTDAVTFDVTSADGFAVIFVYAVLADSISTVLVYDSALGFGGEVDAGSSVVGTTTKSFTIVYDDDGWPTDYDLYVRAATSLGGFATDVQSYTLTDPPDPPDSSSPTVTLVSPPVGSRLQRGTAIVIDVTDPSGLAAVCMWAEYEAGGFPDDIIHNGERFSAQCREGSTREAIANGYRYTIRRAGGWPAPPTVYVRPVDTEGNTP